MWSAYVFVEVYLGEHLMVGEEVYFRRYTELQAYIQECNGNVSDDVWNLLASLGIGMADSQMDASNPLLGPDGLGGGGGSNRRPDYSIGHKGDGKILQREGVTEGELLVYGPSSDGKLNELAHDLGGKTLNDLKGGPSMSGYSDWGEYSKAVLKETPSRKVRVYFDLTNMKDIKGVLNNMGEFKDSVTAQELRYIRDNWSFFEDNVEFYKDGIRRSLPPWIE